MVIGYVSRGLIVLFSDSGEGKRRGESVGTVQLREFYGRW